LTIQGLNFSTAATSGYTLSASSATLTLTNVGTGATGAIEAANTSGTNTISAPLILGGATSSTAEIKQASGGTLVISGAISSTNTEGLLIDGAGTVTLNGSNTFSGPTSVSSGSTLQLGNTGALTSSALTLNGSTGTTTLQLRGASSGSFTMGSQTINGVAGNVYLDNAQTNGVSSTFTIDVGSTNSTAITETLGTVIYTGYYAGNNSNPTLNVTNSTSDGSGLTIGAIVGSGTTAYGQTDNVFTINSSITNLNIGSYTGSTHYGTTLTIGGTGNTTFTGALGATAGLSVAEIGTGTLTLNGASTYTGGTSVAAGGTIRLGNTGALTSSALTLNGSTGTTTLQLRGASSGSFTMGSQTINGVAGNVYLDNAQTNGVSSTFTVDVGSTNSTAITETLGKVIYTGYYAGNNSNPTLNVTNSTSDGSGLTIGAILGSGTTAYGQTDNVFTINSSITNLNIGSYTGSTHYGTTLTIGGTGNTTFTGALAATAGLSVAKTGTGTLTLNGASTYTGGTSVAAGGAIQLGNTGALTSSALTLAGGTSGATTALQLRGSSSGSFTMGSQTTNGVSNNVYLNGATAANTSFTIDVASTNSTALTFTLGTLAYSGNFTNPNNYTPTLNVTNSNSDGSGLTIGAIKASVNGANPPANYFAINSSIANLSIGTFTPDGTNSGFLTIGGTGNTTFTGAISNGAGLVVTKTGTGTLTLNGGDSYTGSTTISNGVVKIGNATALGTGAGAVSVAAGAALDLNGTTPTDNNALTLNGTGVSSGGALTDSGAAATYGGKVTLGSSGVAIGGAGAITLSTGTITGSGDNLTLQGVGGTVSSIIGTGAGTVTVNTTGTWTLSNANTATGLTSISAGAVNLTGSVAGPLTVGSGASLTGFGTSSTTGAVSGLGTVNGGGVINLTAANSADKLTLNGLTLGGSGSAFTTGQFSTLNFTYGVNGFESIAVGSSFASPTGTLTVNSGGAYVDILGTLNTGTYTLLSFGAGNQAGTGTFSLSNSSITNTLLVGADTYTLVDNSSGGLLQLDVTGTPIPGVAYWKGGVGTVWNVLSGSSTNWSTDLPGATDAGNTPGVNTDVIFSANSQTGAINTTLGASTTINSLNFNANPASTTISADTSTLTIAALGDSNTSTDAGPNYTGNTAGTGIKIGGGAGAVTINVPINLGNSQTWTNGSANTFTVGGNVAGTAATSATQTLTLTDTSTGATAITGNIGNGSAGGKVALLVNSSGSGLVKLSGTDSYTGGTTISAGGLQLGGAGALPSTGALVVGTTSTAATLDLNANNATVGGTFSGSTGGMVTSNAAGTGTYTLTVNNTAGGTQTYAGLIQDGSTNFVGLALGSTNTGVLALTGASTYSGGTSIGAGTLQVGNATALGSGAVSVTSGAALDLNGTTMTSTGGLTLNGTGISNGGALTNSSSTAATYAGLAALGSSGVSIGGTGSITLSNVGTITGSGDNLTLNGAGGTVSSIIGTGAGTLTVSGTGTWVLAGANTFTGNTSVSGGSTLQLTNANALQNSALTLNGGTSGTTALQLRGTANTTFAGGTQTNSSIVNNIRLNTSTAGSSSFTIDVGSTNSTADTMTLGTLAYSDYYNGGSGFYYATLNVTNSTADNSGLTIGSIKGAGGTLSGLGGNFSAGFTINSSIQNLSVGSYTGDPNYATVLTVTGSGNTTFTGNLGAGAGLSVTDTATGTVTLAGNTTYTGATTISAGTFQLGNGGTTGSVAGTTSIIDNANLTVNRSDAVTQASLLNNQVVSGTGSFVQAGSGTTTLTLANTYHGGTTVGAGALYLNNTTGSATGDGSLVVGAGATLGGIGSSVGTTGKSFTIGAATGAPAQVLAGFNTAASTDTTKSLTLTSASGTIQNSNLTFNISTTSLGSSSQLSVGSTPITFGAGTGAQATTLSLNLVGANIIPANTGYVLIAGTNGGVDQYTGLSLGTATGSLATGLTTPITNSGVGGTGNVTLAFTTPGGATYYAPSYLFLYQNSTTGTDDIEVEVVPEPSTWAMMLGGLGVLLLWQRRRRDRSQP
jgi:autotransporter-associated beta strand protein